MTWRGGQVWERGRAVADRAKAPNCLAGQEEHEGHEREKPQRNPEDETNH